MNPELRPGDDARRDENSSALMAMPLFFADGLRFVVEILLYGAASLSAGLCFLPLFDTGTPWGRLLAFPAACVGFLFGFYIALIIVILLFLRKIPPGAYSIKTSEALRWVMADSLMRMIERSFLRGAIKGFALQRYVFFRLLGAHIDSTFFIGWDVRILDPWLLKVGRGSLIGSFVVVSGHAVENDRVTLAPVKIGDRVTVGMRAIIMPGVEIGDGAIVGAGAVVTKGTHIPPGEIWAGVPARRIGQTQTGDATEA